MKSLHSFLAVVFTAVLLASFGRAQNANDEEYSREFRKGYDALVAGKHEEGIVSMKRCLEMRPNDPSPAYNLTCAYALRNETELAVEWFDKAVDWGFGFTSTQNLEWPKSDKDLDNIRADPRFVAALERLAAQGKRVEEYFSKPIVYLPKALESAATTPLLVVLHDRGQTKEELFANGPWKRVADELGYALVIPSGKVPLHVHPELAPEKGMGWITNMSDYEQNYWKLEKPAVDAVSAFRKQHKLDPARVHIVGVGEGATTAFNIALSSPGLYRGVVTYMGAANLRLVGTKAGNAAKLGLQSVWLFPSRPFGDFRVVPDEDYPQLLDRLGQAFKSIGLRGGLRTFDPPAATESTTDATSNGQVDYETIKSALQSFAGADSDTKPADGPGGGVSSGQ